MCRSDVDDSAPFALFHLWQRQPAGVKRRSKIDRDDRVPFVDRKFVYRRHVLDTGVVDEDVDGAKPVDGLRHHLLDGRRIAHVGAVISDVYAVFGNKAVLQLFYGSLLPEAIENDMATFGGQSIRDAEANTARRTSDERGLSLEHYDLPSCRTLGPARSSRRGGVSVAYESERKRSRLKMPTVYRFDACGLYWGLKRSEMAKYFRRLHPPPEVRIYLGVPDGPGRIYDVGGGHRQHPDPGAVAVTLGKIDAEI